MNRWTRTVEREGRGWRWGPDEVLLGGLMGATCHSKECSQFKIEVISFNKPIAGEYSPLAGCEALLCTHAYLEK